MKHPVRAISGLLATLRHHQDRHCAPAAPGEALRSRKIAARSLALTTLLTVAACGGGGGDEAGSTPQPTPAPVSVSIAPATASVLVGSPARFSGTATGGSTAAVVYSVVEGNAGGQVTSDGNYLAPLAAGTYHVRATSVADPTRWAEATVTVRDYANQVTVVASPTDGYDYHTASLLMDGSVLLIGGRGLLGQVHQQMERYLPLQDRYAADGLLVTRREAHASSALPDGKVLVAGGYDPYIAGSGFDPVFKSTEVYDPVARTSSAGPDMNFPRRGHVATPLDDGRVLITGGLQLRGTGFGASPNTEIYEPSGNRFVAGERMATGRWLHTATLLPDGRVLIAGGRDNNCTETCPVYSLKTAELFDPATGVFSPTGSLNYGRFGHTATVLNDGRVLILGGQSTESPDPTNDLVATSEVYDPATGKFTTWTSLVLPRSSHTTTLLNNGKLLVAGGYRVAGVIVTARTEIFDPVTGVSTEGPSMSEQHVRHTATRLPSGEVLIFGGSNGGQPVPVAEIFH